ncbi:MAG: BCD family MFS transporter, partial [Pseudomonadota bacterium]
MTAAHSPYTDKATLGWLGVVRLGLVQAALGAIVVLTTSTLNRVMVVEMALPALLPGALVGWHYAVQMSRPRWGYGADIGGKRAPWIIGGMATLAIGAIGAAGATMLMASAISAGIAAGFVAFLLIGVGVGAAGTNLLALLATRTPPTRKSAAAAIVWIMMIVGFVITAAIAGQMLDPFSMRRLFTVTVAVSLGAFALAALAVLGVEKTQIAEPQDRPAPTPFWDAMREIWREQQARRFTIFVFVSMLAYSAQDLILEPFAGLIYGYTPGESTTLAGVQNGGVLLGMIATAIIGTTIGKSRAGFMRLWTICGCIASAFSLMALALGASLSATWPLSLNVFALGLSNGAFAVAAIGSMMTLASAGREGSEGARMGVWGASQAIAFGLGGFIGAAAIDLTRMIFADVGSAFAFVFGFEGLMFVAAAVLAARVGRSAADEIRLPVMPAG